MDQQVFNTIIFYDLIVSNTYKFQCKFCGEDFGDDVVELAVHIGRVHDSPRDSLSE